MSSSSQSQNLDVTLSLSLPPRNEGLNPQERGIKLIQLLLSCANHASSGNLHHADTCLHHISELASVTGDSMQRLAARFAAALAARLLKRWPGLYKALNNGGLVGFDVDRARSIFARAFPCLGFAYAVINRTLIQALLGEREVHVIDLGCGDPKLWVPFVRAMADGPNGPPRLKITSVGINKEAQERLEGRILKEGQSLKMEIVLNHVDAKLRDLSLDMLEVKPGEALALTSILSLHVLLAEDDGVDARFGLRSKNNQVSECKRMVEFLEMVRSVGPKVVLLVEQESNHNSSRLVDRFVEGLHFYSALFDLIDATFGALSCSNRATLEEMFGREIENIVAGEGLEREERHERYAKWGIRFTTSGFRPIHLWYDSMEEARKVVEAYGPRGFSIISERGSLMICWHDRPIYAVSAWSLF
ncbi:scarecrow-like protein 3 [Salvia miltiorrhiza]|uniref:scarecrow-like protein 3 n=1 Tax=Salvia miltiorrhiza TaxID=226208 RepID=UPI0025ABEE0B|nr:scarecrow-like protein 3 [Salvia miltiorrhiza]